MNGKYKTYLKITFLPTPASLKKNQENRLPENCDCTESIK